MFKKTLLALAAMAIVGPTTIQSVAAQSTDRYIKTPTGYLMVLRHGDDVLTQLEQLTLRERIPSATITGIGFAREATFGFYDFGKKAFDPKTFRNVEVASLTGSLAWKEGKPSIHVHGTVTDGTFGTYGGHLLGLVIGTGSAEITVVLHDKQLERAVDPSIGANVLGL
jgi:predicted DNA-binding protein with PD1-like motif